MTIRETIKRLTGEPWSNDESSVYAGPRGTDGHRVRHLFDVSGDALTEEEDERLAAALVELVNDDDTDQRMLADYLLKVSTKLGRQVTHAPTGSVRIEETGEAILAAIEKLQASVPLVPGEVGAADQSAPAFAVGDRVRVIDNSVSAAKVGDVGAVVYVQLRPGHSNGHLYTVDHLPCGPQVFAEKRIEPAPQPFPTSLGEQAAGDGADGDALVELTVPEQTLAAVHAELEASGIPARDVVDWTRQVVSTLVAYRREAEIRMVWDHLEVIDGA